MAYVEVTINVDIDSFEDDDLIDELEGRGYIIRDPEDWLTSEEIATIVDMAARGKPGTIEYKIYEKLRKR